MDLGQSGARGESAASVQSKGETGGNGQPAMPISQCETGILRPVDHSALHVAGYAAPWTTSASGSISFHLSAAEDISRTRIVRIDTPQRIETDWPIRTIQSPEQQHFCQGSFASLSATELARLGKVHEIAFEIYLTRNPGERVIVQADDVSLRIKDGRLSLCTAEHVHAFDGVIPSKTWLRVILSSKPDGLTLTIDSCSTWTPFSFSETISNVTLEKIKDAIRFGFGKLGETNTLNGKYSKFRIRTESGNVSWTIPTLYTDTPLKCDQAEHAIALEFHNLPTFCVTSSRWDGTSYEPRHVPDHYDAVQFHDDDMSGLNWPATHEVTVPETAPSGIYALEVAFKGGQEDIVFFVAASKPQADLVFVAPTATYLAYADEVLPEAHFPWQCEDRGHRFAVQNNLRSLYDYHSDLSGVSICSYLKPKALLREDYLYPLCGSPHNLPVDLHLLRFCHRQGIAFDLVTDHNLHASGVELLAGRKAVMTGSHPEYMSVEMERAFRDFAQSGGSIAYLGGNGFAATVAIKDDLMELRRSSLEAGRTWDGWVYEQSLALTNEPGGLLRNRGRGEFSLIGGAISLMGFDKAHAFTRTEASDATEVSWIFEGVEGRDFGHGGIVLGGAAGYEVDATDQHLGTSPDTVVIARADGFNEHFQQDITRWYEGGLSELLSKRCAEMTIRQLPSGGFIFSASSVAWCGALPDDETLNDVGRITLNILSRMMV